MTGNLVMRSANFINNGAEAMLLSFRNALLREMPEASVWAQMGGGDAQRAMLEGMSPLVARSEGRRFRHRALTDVLFAHASLRRPFGELRRRHAQAIQMRSVGPCDVVDLAGFGYGDAWSTERADASIGWKNFALRNGGKVVYAPQAWGPFEKSHWKELLPGLLDGAEFYARDPLSRDYLSAALRAPVPLQCDSAFSFSGGSKAHGEALLARFAWNDPSKPLVVFTPNMRLYERSEGKGGGNAMVKALAESIRALRRAADVRILLLANEMSFEHRRNDDRYLCALLETVCGEPGEIEACRDWLSAADVRSILMNAEMAVSARYHSILLASTSLCPALALGWSHKYEYLLADVGLGEWTVHGEKAEWELLPERTLELWDRRSEARAVLGRTIPGLRKNATDFLDGLAKRLHAD